ncbi:TraX family protein [Bacillus cereus]|nr:TraX family protein [Bacillus cereus]
MQLLAMLTMLVDHIGYVFFPDQIIWRMVGRLAFPIYAYCIVVGYRHTTSLKMYLLRLAVIGLISQIPYYLNNIEGLNVVGTLFVGLVVLYILDRYKSGVLRILMTTAAAIVLELFSFDYGIYGLILILIYRYSKNGIMFLLHFMLNLAFMFTKGWYLAIFSSFSTLGIAYAQLLFSFIERIRIPKWLWRSFYPLHLSVLALVNYIATKN